MRIISGEWGGRRIQAPKGRDVRPTTDRVRESWMSILAPGLPGARVVDLFAGSGALGLECLSRGAAHATFVERAREAQRAIQANMETLQTGDSARLVRGDAFSWLAGVSPHTFDLALADPPYEEGYAARLIQLFSEHPFARELWVEHRTGEPLPPLEGLRSRRYGDTTLTHIESPP